MWHFAIFCKSSLNYQTNLNPLSKYHKIWLLTNVRSNITLQLETGLLVKGTLRLTAVIFVQTSKKLVLRTF